MWSRNSRNFKKYPRKNHKPYSRREFVNNISNASDGCLLPKFCKGKHKPMTQDKTLLENAEQLFKNQQIKVVNTEKECQEVVRELLLHCKEYNVLGLDCEFISQYRRYPVALLQLASHRGFCALIRLCKLKKIPRELQQLLEDENIIKVGVQTFMDGNYLVQDYGIARVASTFDIRILAEKCGFPALGLGKLSEEHLKVQLNKNPCISAAGWEDETLKDDRIEYAAKDVHVSVELFKIFAEKLKPKPVDIDQKEHLQEFIKEHCAQNLNVKWTKSGGNHEPKTKPEPFRNQTIRVIKTVKECQAVMQELKSHCVEYNVLGLKFLKADVWSDRKRMDLLQLATHRGLCAIIYLNNFKYLPMELQQILNDQTILKVGVDPRSNMNNNIRIKSTLELNYLLSAYKKKPIYIGMPALCKWFLKVKLDNNPSKKLSNIEKNYTKNEAQLAIEIFKQFFERLEFEKDGNDHKMNLCGFIKRYCAPYVDMSYDSASVRV